MPTETMRRGVLRWRGFVRVDGKIVASKWFGRGGKEQRKAIIWEEAEKERLMEEARQEAVEQLKTGTGSVRPLGWAESYLDDVELRCTKKTYDEKNGAFVRLFKFTRGTPLADFQPGLILRFLQGECKNRSGHAANKDRKNLMTAWEWGRKYLTDFPNLANPFAAVERFPEEPQGRYVPPEEDFWKVFEKAQGQDRVMLFAFLHLAARRGELFRLKWSDVDFQKGQVRLTTRKTKDGSMRADWIPMTNDLKSILRRWWAGRPYPASEFVFTMLEDACSGFSPGDPFKHRQHVMKKICKKAGVKPFGFHAIRHLTAVMLYKSGQPLSVIQKILRHQHPSTTEKYLVSLGFEAEHIREALEAIGKGGPAKVIQMPKKENAL